MQKTKRGSDGNKYYASAFLHVPNADAPLTWGLRYKEFVEGKVKPTQYQLGVASLAFSPLAERLGRRIGLTLEEEKRYKRQIRNLYRSIGVPLEEIPPYLLEVESQKGEVLSEGTFRECFSNKIIDEEVRVEKFDREAGILRNIPILGMNSANRRRYMPDVVKDANARKLYEGAPCFINHVPDLSRGRVVQDLAGEWRNIRFDETKNMNRADLYTMEQHRDLIFDVVENAPGQVAPSHVVEGRTKKTKGGQGEVVEDVTFIGKVHSVDLVVGAATVKSMMEGSDMDGIEKLTLDEIKKQRPDLVEALNLENNGPSKKEGGDDDREYKRLYETEKTMRVNAEKRAKEVEDERVREKELAQTKELLETVLKRYDKKGESLPDKAKEMLRTATSEKVLTESQVEALVKNQIDYVLGVGGSLKKKEVQENKVTLPEEESKNDKKSDSKILSEAFLSLGGIEVKEEKEGKK